MTINNWNSDSPVEVALGGTAENTLPANEVLIGDGGNLQTAGGSNGQILVGTTAAAPSFITPLATSNQVDYTSGINSGAWAIADNPILPGDVATQVPVGDTAQEPTTPTGGMLRYNTDNDLLEGYYGGQWKDFSVNTPTTSYLGTFGVGSGTFVDFSSFSASFSFYYIKIYLGLPSSNTYSLRFNVFSGGVSTGPTGGYFNGTTGSSTLDGFGLPLVSPDGDFVFSSGTPLIEVYLQNWTGGNAWSSIWASIAAEDGSGTPFVCYGAAPFNVLTYDTLRLSITGGATMGSTFFEVYGIRS